MDDGTFGSFIDGIAHRYDSEDAVTVIHEPDGAGDTVRLIVVDATREDVRDTAADVAETLRQDYNARTRVVTTYGKNKNGDYAAEILAIPEHG